MTDPPPFPPPSGHVPQKLFCDLGQRPYVETYRLQLALVERRRSGQLGQDVFLTVDHPPVFTLGRRGNREYLGVGEDFLAARSIELVAVERGGEITYHGPGQLVLYPIVNLRQTRLTVAAYVHLLEELMLQLAADFGVQATRDARNHGIWANGRKLGSIGIAIRHGITFHGMALNVNNSLDPFRWITPCGLQDVAMTSLAAERQKECAMTVVHARLRQRLSRLFASPFQSAPLEELLPDPLS